MSSDFNDICKQGYVKLKSKKIGLWKRRWLIVCRRSSKGERRIEKFSDEKAAVTRAEPRNIPLTGVQCVSRLPKDVQKHGVHIMFTDKTSMQFGVESELEADSWVQILTDVSTSHVNALPSMDLLQCGQHSRQDVFSVYLLPTPLLTVYGECLMRVTSEDVHLLALDEPHGLIQSWPLACLRKYGRDATKFTFECGRHSKTGEGLFIFNTIEGEKIYQKVHSATLAIASAHRIVKKQEDRPPLEKSVSVSVPSSSVKHSDLRMTKSHGVEGERVHQHTNYRRPSRPLPEIPASNPSLCSLTMLKNDLAPEVPPPIIHSRSCSTKVLNPNETTLEKMSSPQSPIKSVNHSNPLYNMPASSNSAPLPLPRVPDKSVHGSLKKPAKCLPTDSTISEASENSPALPSRGFLSPLDNDSEDEKDDYEYLTRTRNGTGPGSSSDHAIRSVDSMLTVSNPIEEYDEAHSVDAYAEPTRLRDRSGRPGPDLTNNNEQEVIYEEKYLSGDFRKFLALRKDDAEIGPDGKLYTDS